MNRTIKKILDQPHIKKALKNTFFVDFLFILFISTIVFFVLKQRFLGSFNDKLNMSEEKLIQKIKERLDDKEFFSKIKEIVVEKAKKELIEKKDQKD